MSTPSELPLTESGFEGVNPSPFPEVKASQVFLHCCAKRAQTAPVLQPEMVQPLHKGYGHGRGMLRLSWQLCTAALRCVGSPPRLELGLIWNLVGMGWISQAFRPAGDQVQPGAGELTSNFCCYRITGSFSLEETFKVTE